MLSWSASVTEIYLDNGWYNAVHMSRSVKYTVGHKKRSQFYFYKLQLMLSQVIEHNLSTMYSNIVISKFQCKLQFKLQ